MAKVYEKNKLIYGIGFNDADYCTNPTVNGRRNECKYYRAWCNMLQRCYDPKYQAKHPTYIDCTVCENWLTFSNFKAWMLTQSWNDKQLDKDILGQYSKIYSPETCIFVTKAINTLFTKCDSSRGQYKLGVYFNKERGKYQAKCSINNKKKHLGYFLTEEEAYQVYKIFKTSHIRSIALEQSDERLKLAMLNYIVE